VLDEVLDILSLQDTVDFIFHQQLVVFDIVQ